MGAPPHRDVEQWLPPIFPTPTVQRTLSLPPEID